MQRWRGVIAASASLGVSGCLLTTEFGDLSGGSMADAREEAGLDANADGAIKDGGSETAAALNQLRRATFESGKVIDPVDGADTLDGTVTLESAAPLGGTYSVGVSTSNSSVTLTTAPQDTMRVTFRLKFRTAPASTPPRAFRLSDGPNQIAALSVDDQLRLRVSGPDFFFIGTPSATIVVGAVYRVVFDYRRGTGGKGLLQAYLMKDGSPLAAPFSTTTNVDLPIAAKSVSFGSSNQHALNAVFDDLELAVLP